MTTPNPKARPTSRPPAKSPPEASVAPAVTEPSAVPPPGIPVRAVEETPPAASNDGHLSETVHVDQWLRLLIVMTTSLLILLAVGVAIRLLAAIGHTLQIFSLGGLLAYAIAPLVDRIRQRRAEKPRP